MAINKKQTSLWVKIVLIFVVVAFVASLVPAFFLGGTQSPPPAEAGTTAATLERVADNYLPTVMSLTTMLESDPTSYTALVDLGNTYIDWGFQLREELGAAGHDQPMWVASAATYERAVAIEAGDPPVEVNMAIAYFYSGQTERAIQIAERVMEESPEYAPTYYNVAIFYRAVGRTDDAIAALERNLEMEPEGPSAPAARDILAQLQAGS